MQDKKRVILEVDATNFISQNNTSYYGIHLKINILERRDTKWTKLEIC